MVESVIVDDEGDLDAIPLNYDYTDCVVFMHSSGIGPMPLSELEQLLETDKFFLPLFNIQGEPRRSMLYGTFLGVSEEPFNSYSLLNDLPYDDKKLESTDFSSGRLNVSRSLFEVSFGDSELKTVHIALSVEYLEQEAINHVQLAVISLALELSREVYDTFVSEYDFLHPTRDALNRHQITDFLNQGMVPSENSGFETGYLH